MYDASGFSDGYETFAHIAGICTIGNQKRTSQQEILIYSRTETYTSSYLIEVSDLYFEGLVSKVRGDP